MSVYKRTINTSEGPANLFSERIVDQLTAEIAALPADQRQRYEGKYSLYAEEVKGWTIIGGDVLPNGTRRIDGYIE